MDLRYTRYLQGDAFFYEVPERTGGVRSNSYDWSIGGLPDGWVRRRSDGWTFLAPSDVLLPRQGWKVHVSATAADTTRTLRDVARYCFATEIPFKYLSTEAVYLAANQKYAERSGSGKFITIYPEDDTATEQVCEDLDSLLGGRPGPYILSDVRFRHGPVYVRYGGFQLATVLNEAGASVPAITAPDGSLVPDERNPWFSPPSWLELPGFVATAVEALGSDDRPDGFNYDVEDALHFSNGGGVYSANDLRTGARVVLKEGRPDAGITADGRDAATRVRDEAAVLRQLDGAGYAPKLIETLSVEGHEFLVEEFIAGRTLNKSSVERMPLIRAGSSIEERHVYRDWAMPILWAIRNAVHDLHARGLVFGDVHPENIIITDDNAPVLVDFEMTSRADAPPPPVMGAPGYVPPDGRVGVDADNYALGVLHLALFVPLGSLLALDPSKAPQLLETVVKQFDLDSSFETTVLDLLGPVPESVDGSHERRAARSVAQTWDVHTTLGLEEVLNAISTGIADSADFSRDDRLYPGDIEQFHSNGWNLAWGAIGVLGSGSISSEQLAARTERWIRHSIAESTARGTAPLGLFDGLSGLQCTQAMQSRGLGDFTRRLQQTDLEQLDSTLASGLAGIGLASLEAPDDRTTKRSREISEVLAQRLFVSAPKTTVATGQGGLMRGTSGAALFWIRHFEVTGESEALDHAEQAIRTDVAALVECPDGSLQMNEGWRAVPYLGTGSAGVGLAIARLLQHRAVPDLTITLERINFATHAGFVIQSGWWNGRAGLIDFQLAVAEPLGLPGTVDHHVEALQQHTLIRGCGVHFPSEQLLRSSTDLLTGSAGIHRVLRRYGLSRGLLAADPVTDPLQLIMPTITNRKDDHALPLDLASAPR
ncbi:class III lanthionine synthetase LanKC [Curtobacterium sp. MCBA15_008]|uniref:class III lanthionine synthetase LanKC n=1 Tax=Curtobacterium sp. MCBA15_008 TaxID=1898736 RepID=UPI000A74F50F|nr:class III lanthionine synthetase LanKC [Curtobacterium sp. MCBA15_008]